MASSHQKGVNKLEDELGGVCTLNKMHHYMEGHKYGHLASVIPQEKYRIVISNNAWTHAAPANPGAYLAAALGVGNAAAQRKQFIAKLGWQFWDLCLSAPPLKQQTFLSVADMSTMLAQHIGDILLCRPIFRLSMSCW
jgi:hypothetical protein